MANICRRVISSILSITTMVSMSYAIRKYIEAQQINSVLTSCNIQSIWNYDAYQKVSNVIYERETQFLMKDLISYLNKIELLKLDAKVDTIDNFKFLNGIRNLELMNLMDLSETNRQTLSKYHFNKVTIICNYPFVFENHTVALLDTTFLDADEIVFEYDKVGHLSEVQQLRIYTFYNLLSKEQKALVNISSFLPNYEEVKKWHDSAKKIVDTFNFDENDSDDYKMMTIVTYVTDRLEYNQEIIDTCLLRKNNQEITEEQDKHYEKLVNDYNKSPIKDYLLNEDKNEGICINYASLTVALGILCDLDVDVVSGSKDNNAHAWCDYVSNGTDYFINPTDENDLVFNIQKQNFKNFQHNRELKDQYINSLNYKFYFNEIFDDRLKNTYIDGKETYENYQDIELENENNYRLSFFQEKTIAETFLPQYEAVYIYYMKSILCLTLSEMLGIVAFAGINRSTNEVRKRNKDNN